MSDARRIPIANIFYLLCYAWNRFKEARALSVDLENAPNTPNMLARALGAATGEILSRGRDRSYAERTEETATVRGRVLMGPTSLLQARRLPAAVCLSDELAHDNLANQLLRATLQRLERAEGLEPSLRGEAIALRRRFSDVSDIRVHAGLFRRVRFHRNNAHYGLALAIAEFIHHCLLPTEREGVWRFVDIDRDERVMARVFEEFLRNFWRSEQRAYRVSVERLGWGAEADLEHLALLPNMVTDVILRRPGRVLIVDAKYYRAALASHLGVEKLISSNLYQLHAYMHAMKRVDDAEVAGMLVYPTTSRELDLDYRIDGSLLSVRTIDLSLPWPDIARRLKAMVADVPGDHKSP